MTAIDALVLTALFALMMLSGLRDRRMASRGLDEYFLAGRTLNGWQAGISMAATQFAADTPLLVTGLVAAGGIFALWRLWIYALAFLLLAFVIAACWRRTGALTDAELAELRYRGRGAAALRLFKALYFGTVFNCVALGIVLLAATRIAEPFLLWNEWLPAGAFRLAETLSAPFADALTATPRERPEFAARAASNLVSLALVALVTLFYSTLGGLRSVVRTDLWQFALMMAGSLVYCGLVVHAAGGLDAMAGRLRATFGSGIGPGSMSVSELLAFTPAAAHGLTGLALAVILLQWLIQVNADGTGYLAQRAMACRDDREARRAAVVFTFAQVLLRSLLWLPVALGLLLLFPPAPALAPGEYVALREATYVRGMAELMPAGLKGVMLAAMIAALASTVDTHLNWGASYWANDIYARFLCRARGREPGGRTLVWVARGSNVLLLALALAVMTQLDSVKTAWEASLLLGAGVGVMLVLRWLWWRVTAPGELAAILASAAFVPLALAAIPEELAPARLLVVAAGSTAAGVAASLWVAPARAADLRDFYLRVRPAGFWSPVAAAAERDPREPLRALGRGLGATLACALTVFGLLVGLGTWLVEATPPAWLPQRGTWIALCLAAALAALPVWLRLGFARSA